MFCPQCGNRIEGGAAFCGTFGSQIDQPKQSNAAKKEASSPILDATPSAKPIQQDIKAAQPSANRTKTFIVIGIIVVALAAVAAVVFFALNMLSPLGQNASTFKQAFEDEKPYTSYLPSSSYVKESPYAIKSLDVENVQKHETDFVTADVKATLENDSFMVNMEFDASYYPTTSAVQKAGGTSGTYTFEPVSVTAEPKRGITIDSANGLENVEAQLSDDKMSCTVKDSESFEYWFADSSIDATYTYTFENSENQPHWAFGDADEIHAVTYKDIDGSYKAKSGDLLDLSEFTISALNPTTGSFAIHCLRPEKIINSASTAAPVSADLTATIDPKHNGKYEMSDGYAYYFEATGSTDRGQKSATASGYFTIGDDGSKTIEVTKASLDGETVWSKVYSENTNSKHTFSGTLYKQ